jgi:hypothetical protein
MLAVWAACNGADGISDIEGKVTRVGASELGSERVSIARAVFKLGSVPLPVVTTRINRFITKGGKGSYPVME